MSRRSTRDSVAVASRERARSPSPSPRKGTISLGDEVKRKLSSVRSQEEKDWNVIVENTARCTINLYETNSQSSGTTSYGKRIDSRQVSSDSNGRPNPDQIVQIIIENVLFKNAKPKRILFDDDLIHSRTVPALSSIKFDQIYANQKPESNYPSRHFGETLVLPKFNVVESKRLVNELNGVLIHLVDRSDSKPTHRTSPRTKDTPKSIPIDPKSSSSGFFTYFLGMLFLIGAVGGVYFLVDNGTLNWYWPISEQDANAFYNNLKNDFASSQPHVPSALKRIFGTHNGRKPLTLHIVGQTDKNSDLIIEHISDLICKKNSDKPVRISGDSEDSVSNQVFQSLKKRPNSVFVIDTSTTKPQNLDFLAATLDENYPHLTLRGETVKTNLATFVFVSQMKLPSNQEMDDFDLLAKKHLQSKSWPDRLCQRLRHVIALL